VKLTDFIKTGQVVLVGYKEASGKNHADWVRPVATTGEGGGAVGNPEKSASGKVKAVTNNALTVTADGKDMVFNISADTNVQARGAGTQARQAGGRLAITDLVSVGDTVQVNYKEAGSTLNASDVRITIKAR
jgi:hypothetical protein